jgi:hypothetical protein
MSTVEAGGPPPGFVEEITKMPSAKDFTIPLSKYAFGGKSSMDAVAWNSFVVTLRSIACSFVLCDFSAFFSWNENISEIEFVDFVNNTAQNYWYKEQILISVLLIVLEGTAREFVVNKTAEGWGWCKLWMGLNKRYSKTSQGHQQSIMDKLSSFAFDDKSEITDQAPKINQLFASAKNAGIGFSKEMRFNYLISSIRKCEAYKAWSTAYATGSLQDLKGMDEDKLLTSLDTFYDSEIVNNRKNKRTVEDAGFNVHEANTHERMVREFNGMKDIFIGFMGMGKGGQKGGPKGKGSGHKGKGAGGSKGHYKGGPKGFPGAKGKGKGKGKGSNCFHCNNPGHMINDCPHYNTLICHTCFAQGYTKTNCPVCNSAHGSNDINSHEIYNVQDPNVAPGFEEEGHPDNFRTDELQHTGWAEGWDSQTYSHECNTCELQNEINSHLLVHNPHELTEGLADGGANTSAISQKTHLDTGSFVTFVEKIAVGKKGAFIETEGYGSLTRYIYCAKDNSKCFPLKIEKVYVCKNANKNILGRVDLNASGFSMHHPSKGCSYLVHDSEPSYRIYLEERNGLSYAQLTAQGVKSGGLNVNLNEKTVDTNDWQPDPQEVANVIEETNTKIDTECFCDEKLENSVIEGDTITRFHIKNSCLKQVWSGLKCWIHPPYVNDLIAKVVDKAIREFSIDPENSAFLLMLPEWRSTSWFKQVEEHFEIVKTFKKGMQLFTIPNRPHFIPTQTTLARNGRVEVGPTPWNVIVWLKCPTTNVLLNTNTKIHALTAHAGAETMETLCDLKVTFNKGMQLSKANFSLISSYCQECMRVNAIHPSANKNSGEYSATRCCETFMVDTHGPIQVMSNEGYLYIVGFIDVFSRFVIIFFMKNKSEFPDILKLFLGKISRSKYATKGMTIQVDGALEFNSITVNIIMTEAGAILRRTMPYVHTNNAIIERFWRTLQAKARVLLSMAQLPMAFWPFAFRHAAWIYNRLPHSFLGRISPFQCITGLVPNWTNVYIFGSQAFAYIDKDLRKKLEDRARECIYIGNFDKTGDGPSDLFINSVGYFLYDTKTKTTFISGMIKVYENLSKVGQVMFNRNLTTTVMSNMFDIEQSLTKDITITNLRVITQYFDKILSHFAFYHKSDRETYALLKIALKNHKEASIWMKLSTFLSAHINNFITVHEYMKKKVALQQNVNLFYPLFSLVNVLFEGKYFQAFLTGTDFRRSMYQVVFVLDGIVEQIDVEKSAIREFGDEVAGIFMADKRTTNDHRLATYIDPRNYKHSQTYPDWKEWLAATTVEFKSIIDMHVLQPIATVARGVNIVGTRFVYKLKRNADNTIDKYKARLVAQGYTQEYYWDYLQTFAPVNSATTLRFLLIVSLVYGLELDHLDVSVAFLHAPIQHYIVVSLPEGFEYKGMKYAVLQKSLYGLKQAAHDWYELQNKVILSFDKRIRRSQVDPCLYFIIDHSTALIILITVHVDDYVVASNSKNWKTSFISFMQSKFNIKNLGPLTYILGISIVWNENRTMLSLNINRLIHDLVSDLGLKDAWPVSTPVESGKSYLPGTMNSNLPDVPYRKVVGKLSWIQNVRHDIKQAVNLFQRFNNCYTIEHWNGLLRIVKYLKGTVDLNLVYRKPLQSFNILSKLSLVVFSDSDWAGDKDTRRSTTGGVIYLCGNPISIISKLQATVALSTAEAELMAMVENAKEALNIIHLAEEVIPVQLPVNIKYDNAGAGFMAENPVNNKRSKHIDIRYKWLNEFIAKKVFAIQHVRSEDNDSDVMTKALPTVSFREKVAKIMNVILTPFQSCLKPCIPPKRKRETYEKIE